MARSIRDRVPADASINMTRSACSYCGASWYTSDLWRDQAGNLVCPLEGPGRDVVALGRANARSAAIIKPPSALSPQGPYYDVENGNGSKDPTINKTRAAVLGS